MSTAILLVAYNRWDLLEKRLLELAASELIPQNVILSVDGSTNIEVNANRNENIHLLKSLNLPFQFDVIFRHANLGCSNHIITAVTETLEQHEKVIIIEDDVSISPCFLGSMTKAFDLIYRLDDVGTIGGFSNFHRKFHFPFIFKKNYWRKTKYFSAWGWGTTREFWKNFVRVSEINNLEDYLSDSITWENFSKRKKEIWLRRFSRGIWDFNVQLVLFKNDKFNLLPVLRLIDNEGFSDERSTHTKHKRPKNLLGKGLSNSPPNRIKTLKFSVFTRLFWSFVDSNLWAADGLFTARAREKGLRTLLRHILSRRRINF